MTIHQASTFLATFLFCTILWAFDLVAGTKEVLRVIADTASLNQLQHFGTYTGHVQFSKGKAHLWAARATTKGDEKNQLILASLYGDKEQQAHYWSQPSPDKPTLHAYADIIYYYPKRNLIKLQGNALVKQGANSMSAASITYDTKAQHVVSQSDSHNRTILILQPDKKTL